MPLAKPLVSLVAFFAFVSQWNNFFLVQVMIASQARLNLQTGLATILASAFYSSPLSPSGILRPDLALGGLLLAAAGHHFLPGDPAQLDEGASGRVRRGLTVRLRPRPRNDCR